jgi:hypothetical protein
MALLCGCISCSLRAVSPTPPRGFCARAAAPYAYASSDAPRPPFCLTNKGTFCEDFDDPGSGAFPAMNLWDGGAIGVVSAPHFSPPNALRTTFTTPSDGTCRYATVDNVNLDRPIPNGYSVEYKILAASLPGKLLHGVAVLSNDTSSGVTCSIYMESRAGGATIAVEPQQSPAPTQYISLSRKIIAGQWSHVVVDVTGAAGARRLSVRIDGVSALEDATLIPQCQSTARIVHVGVGLICVTAELAGDEDVAFDDIRVIAR